MILSYNDVDFAIADLINELNDKDIENPIVAPILRGGKYPGEIIAEWYSNFPNLAPIEYTTRHGEKKNNLSGWISRILVSPIIRPVILVDDLIDTGETLIEINKQLIDHGIDIIYNVVLYRKPHSPHIENLIYAREVPNVWLQFPWESE